MCENLFDVETGEIDFQSQLLQLSFKNWRVWNFVPETFSQIDSYYPSCVQMCNFFENIIKSHVFLPMYWNTHEFGQIMFRIV